MTPATMICLRKIVYVYFTVKKCRTNIILVIIDIIFYKTQPARLEFVNEGVIFFDI